MFNFNFAGDFHAHRFLLLTLNPSIQVINDEIKMHPKYPRKCQNTIRLSSNNCWGYFNLRIFVRNLANTTLKVNRFYSTHTFVNKLFKHRAVFFCKSNSNNEVNFRSDGFVQKENYLGKKVVEQFRDNVTFTTM